MKVSQLKIKANNPRKIDQPQIEKLMRSIKDFPKMMEIRPIVYDPDTMEVLGGNQRLTACKKLGMKELPETWIRSADSLTEDEKRRFVIQDNHQSGDWDFEILDAEWGDIDLEGMGIVYPDSPEIDTQEPIDENPYTQKIEIPQYEPKNEKPSISELCNKQKQADLIKSIMESDIDADTKGFLVDAAQRHIVFNYAKIADFYAHSDKQTQELMEQSGLVIIDFQDAIANGYVKLSKDIAELYGEDYPDEG